MLRLCLLHRQWNILSAAVVVVHCNQQSHITAPHQVRSKALLQPGVTTTCTMLALCIR